MEKNHPEGIVNDKLIVVRNASLYEIKRHITEFCERFRKFERLTLPSLTIVSESEVAITFPRGLDFDLFCFFVNYMHYGFCDTRFVEVRGWTSTKPGDEWMTEKIVNQHVMLYAQTDEDEYDKVFLTTSDNRGYEIGFGWRQKWKPLAKPIEMYQLPHRDDSHA